AMLTVEIDGDAELRARFAAMPESIRAALARKIAGLAQRLEDKIKNDKLSGEVLRARSGRLRQSIAARLEESGAALFAVGVKYAAAQEYGFDGAESVSAHSRAIREAFGRAITPKTIFVNAFSRHMRLPERSYM